MANWRRLRTILKYTAEHLVLLSFNSSYISRHGYIDIEITKRLEYVEENQNGIQFLCDGGAHEIH
mgnify:FL=1